MRNPKTTDKSPRDAWWNPWLIPFGQSLKALAADIQTALETNETRQRLRKPDDQLRFVSSLNALVANLAASVLAPSETGAIATPLGNAKTAGSTRYGHPLIPMKTLKAVLRAGEELGLLTITPGHTGLTSTIRPTDGFKDAMVSAGVNLDDICISDDDQAETIILTRKRLEVLGEGISAEPRVYSERVGYRDTPETVRMRQEMLGVNEWLANANLDFVDDGQSPRIDISQRQLRRYFNLHPQDGTASRFDQGGRLFGAFWVNLERTRRRTSLRIDGEPIAEVDYSALFLRIAMAELGASIPAALQADPYAIPGFPSEHRQGLKAALNAMFFSDGELQRMPPDVAAEMPPSWTAKATRQAILEAYPMLGDVFGQRAGWRFMFTESQIMMKVLAEMQRLGVTMLPLHDAALVARGKAEVVRRVMLAAGEQLIGTAIPVSVKL